MAQAERRLGVGIEIKIADRRLVNPNFLGSGIMSSIPQIFLAIVLVVGCVGCEPPSSNIVEAVSRKNYDPEEVRDFLKADPTAIDETNQYDQRPLQIAAGSDRVEAVTLLLDAGADVNATDDIGQSALHAVCDSGELEIAKLLLDAKADVTLADNDGNTPLHTVVGYDWDSIELVRLLIASGADVNAKNKEGETPLDIAVGLKEYYEKPSHDRERSFDREMIKQLDAVEEVLKKAMAENGT